MSTAAEWRIAAVHEASHAYIYAHHDKLIVSIRIWETDDGEVVGSVRVPGGLYSPTMKAVAALAGMVAERRVTSRSWQELVDGPARTDVRMAQDALARCRDPVPSLVAVIVATRAIVDRHWPVIERIAEELVRCGELDERDVVVGELPEPELFDADSWVYPANAPGEGG